MYSWIDIIYTCSIQQGDEDIFLYFSFISGFNNYSMGEEIPPE